MSFIQQPQLINLPAGPNGRKRYALSFSYDWTNDPASSLINIAGEAFYGGQFSLSSNQAGSNIGALEFKSMAFTQQFDATAGTPAAPPTTPFIDGALYIQVPSTGQFHIFGMDQSTLEQAASLPASANRPIFSLTGVIPIVGSSPTTIVFGKGVAPDAQIVPFGKLWVTLLTDEIRPFLRGGFYERTMYDLV